MGYYCAVMRVSHDKGLCIEKAAEKLVYLLKLGTLQGELVENEHSKNGSSTCL